MSILSVVGVTKQYRKKRRQILALQDVNLEINEGEFIAITGQSGSGKSTLVQILGGLDTPTGGQVLYQNQDISKFSSRDLARFRSRNIGFIFQNFYLQPFLTLRENIQLPGYFTGKISAKHTETLAKFVGLEDRLDHLPSELSGGQVQRAAIIRALYNNPKIILADEPTGNLDDENSENILKLLKIINKELGATVIVVTHDQKVLPYADRVVKLTDGKIQNDQL
ncbi:MAG: ABC transporter ATP-binding protein [Candidatus Sacchiramonaceae bacterium]|nr:ABC transporter ATP-binding protein [Candidatus Saccharimonadaceae bacterium]